jgi:hypothetical protein
MNMASVVAQSNGDGYSPNMVLPRPQIGIERLQARRASNEPKEAMNCKSCRKRKVRILLETETMSTLLTLSVRSSAIGSNRPARRVRLSTAPAYMVGHISCFKAIALREEVADRIPKMLHRRNEVPRQTCWRHCSSG